MNSSKFLIILEIQFPNLNSSLTLVCSNDRMFIKRMQRFRFDTRVKFMLNVQNKYQISNIWQWLNRWNAKGMVISHTNTSALPLIYEHIQFFFFKFADTCDHIIHTIPQKMLQILLTKSKWIRNWKQVSMARNLVSWTNSIF